MPTDHPSGHRQPSQTDRNCPQQPILSSVLTCTVRRRLGLVTQLRLWQRSAVLAQLRAAVVGVAAVRIVQIRLVKVQPVDGTHAGQVGGGGGLVRAGHGQPGHIRFEQASSQKFMTMQTTWVTKPKPKNSPNTNKISDRVTALVQMIADIIREAAVRVCRPLGSSPPVDVFVVFDHVFRRLRYAAGAGFRGELLLLSGGVHLRRPDGRSVRVWSVPSTAAGPVTPPPPRAGPHPSTPRPVRWQHVSRDWLHGIRCPPSHSIPCQPG